MLVEDALYRRAQRARADIASGALRGAALLEQLRAVPFADRDAWIDEALGFESPPPDEPLPPGAVPYLPCGVDEIIAMVQELPLRSTDVLVDLGSGLGRVVILAHLLSGAQACGIEIQEHLVHSARARAAELGLDAVSFTHGNAAELALAGSVFFLYAPFNGAMLASVMARLAEHARHQPFVICATGVELDAAWLHARAMRHRTLAIYDARA